MNAIELRNLQEQVLKNKEDILKHFQRDEVLADFGIRIIGQVETEEELNALPTEGLEYGDAYAVGAQSPFNYYIWTRANNLSDVDYWFAFGEIAIVGPQGPKGDTIVGPKGETGQSTRWYLYNDAQWNYPSGYKPGDMALTYPSGNVYIVGDNGLWEGQANIRGPIGKTGNTGRPFTFADFTPEQLEQLRGPKGDTGDVGGFINIAGIVNTEYDLPDPSLINNLTVAYLVGTAEPYTLYIQVGSNSRDAEWLDAGPLNVATMVTVNGQYQNTWNADTKLDKVTTQTPNNQAYVKSYDGRQSMVDISPVPAIWLLASYDGQGHLKTSPPEEDADCVNKGYADANYGPVTITVEDQITAWDDGDYFSMLDSYYYTIHTFATYLYEGHAYTINFKPASMFTGDDSWAMAEVNFIPGYDNLPGFTDEMLKQIQVSYHYTTNTPEICNYWLREPEAGYPDGVSGLTLTVILERLY